MVLQPEGLIITVENVQNKIAITYSYSSFLSVDFLCV